jgi:hypothetical protein
VRKRARTPPGRLWGQLETLRTQRTPPIAL